MIGKTPALDESILSLCTSRFPAVPESKRGHSKHSWNVLVLFYVCQYNSILPKRQVIFKLFFRLFQQNRIIPSFLLRSPGLRQSPASKAYADQIPCLPGLFLLLHILLSLPQRKAGTLYLH